MAALLLLITVAIGVDLLLNSKLNMFGNSSISTNGLRATYFTGDNAVVTLNDNATIIAQNGIGIVANGDSAVITLSDNSSVQANGTGVSLTGNNSTAWRVGAFIDSFSVCEWDHPRV